MYFLKSYVFSYILCCYQCSPIALNDTLIFKISVVLFEFLLRKLCIFCNVGYTQLLFLYYNFDIFICKEFCRCHIQADR